jgi:general nucleoside transport system permease protein
VTVEASAGRPTLLDRLPRGARAVGMLGMLLGALAFWLALPPVAARSPVWSIAVGIVAAFCGLWAVTHGQRRIGWGALAVAAIGIAGGILATRSSMENLDVVVSWSALAAATLRFATPLTFAALGGIFSERSGVVNIGLEGMMLMGAFFGILGADKTDSWVLGLLIAMAAGGGLALVHAFFAIHLRADQIVVGTGINFLALGATGYLFVDIYGAEGTPTDIPEIWTPHLGFLSSIPDVQIGSVEFGGTFLEQIFGDLDLMIWLSFALLVLSYVVMFKTPIGLRIRSVGEHPRAADTVGISVYGVRYAAVLVSGALAALGGAYLSLSLGLFDQNMTGGRGFIAIAALIFGNWRPFGAFAACLLFGFSSALADRLPEYFEQGSSTPLLFNALPYVLTLIAVAGVIGRSIPPAAIGRPYEKQ